jgi:hypothetical protein
MTHGKSCANITTLKLCIEVHWRTGRQRFSGQQQAANNRGWIQIEAKSLKIVPCTAGGRVMIDPSYLQKPGDIAPAKEAHVFREVKFVRRY